MKTLKSMSFDKKLTNSELKAIRGGNNQCRVPGVDVDAKMDRMSGFSIIWNVNQL